VCLADQQLAPLREAPVQHLRLQLLVTLLQPSERDAYIDSVCLSLTNAFLKVRGFLPKLGFFADFLYAYIINLTGDAIILR
jgi:hypothetical protein